MHASSTIRLQIESALAHKIPSAFTPAPRMIRPVAPTGIESLDEVLQGGLPVGAVSELVGPECSGRTSVALSFLAQTTQTARVCAWIDVCDTLDPALAASIGVDLKRMLWVRCGAVAAKQNFRKPWSRMEQALRTTDLLLQSGGFSVIVLDMGSLTPEAASRVPLATWFRYRAAAERTQSSILLLTQHPCAKSSAELVLRFQPAHAICAERTVFSGIEPHVEVMRQRFTETPTNVIPLRKPPQRANAASWKSRTVWTGSR